MNRENQKVIHVAPVIYTTHVRADAAAAHSNLSATEPERRVIHHRLPISHQPSSISNTLPKEETHTDKSNSHHLYPVASEESLSDGVLSTVSSAPPSIKSSDSERVAREYPSITSTSTKKSHHRDVPPPPHKMIERHERILSPSSSSQQPKEIVTTTMTSASPKHRVIQTQQKLLTMYPPNCFLIESAQQKDHFWCVASSMLHHNQVVVRYCPLQIARHDARFLWFVKEGEPFIYSLLKKKGECLVLDYHESTYSFGLSKSMVVKRRKTHKELQHYEIIPYGGMDSQFGHVRIHNTGTRRFVRPRSFKMGGDSMIRLKSGGGAGLGEWRTIPADQDELESLRVAKSAVEAHEVVEVQGHQYNLVRLPIDAVASDWFMDINSGVPVAELRKKWDMENMLNVRDEFGYNALMRAVMRSNWELTNYLLSNFSQMHTRMQVEARDDYNQTALHLAAYRGHLTIVNALVERGADIEARDRKGCTALFDAAARNRVVLLDFFLKRDRWIVMKHNKLSQNILHFCVMDKCTDALKHLLESGMLDKTMLSHLDQKGYAPIHYAAADGYMEGVRLLLDYGSDPNWRSEEDSETPLHLAAENMHTAVLIAILTYCTRTNIDESIKDAYGLTAREIALRNGLDYPDTSLMRKYNARLSLRNETTGTTKRVGRGTSSTAATQLQKTPPAKTKVRLSRSHVLEAIPFNLVAEKSPDMQEEWVFQVDMDTHLRSKDHVTRYPVVLMPVKKGLYEQEFAMTRHNNILSLGTNAVLTYMPDTRGRMRLVAAPPESQRCLKRWIFKAGHLCTSDEQWCVCIESSATSESKRNAFTSSTPKKYRNSIFRGVQMRGKGLILRRIRNMTESGVLHVMGDRNPVRFMLDAC